jgi:prevent-host-death family protein
MREFTAQDMQRNVGLVQEAALQEPVAITYRGRRRVVLLSSAEYDRLLLAAGVAVRAAGVADADDDALEARAVGLGEIPPEFAADLANPLTSDEVAALNHDHEAGSVDYIPPGATLEQIRELSRKNERG